MGPGVIRAAMLIGVFTCAIVAGSLHGKPSPVEPELRLDILETGVARLSLRRSDGTTESSEGGPDLPFEVPVFSQVETRTLDVWAAQGTRCHEVRGPLRDTVIAYGIETIRLQDPAGRFAAPPPFEPVASVISRSPGGVVEVVVDDRIRVNVHPFGAVRPTSPVDLPLGDPQAGTALRRVVDNADPRFRVVLRVRGNPPFAETVRLLGPLAERYADRFGWMW